MLRSTRQVSETHESGVYLNRMIHQWYPAQYGGKMPDQMLSRWSETPFFKVVHPVHVDDLNPGNR